jgi:glycogen debranching enzyme
VGARAWHDGRGAEDAAEPTILAGTGTLTLIDGLTFAISNASGDIGDGLDGLIADDTRHLSHLAVRIEGAPVRPLGAALLTAGSARFRGFVAPERGYPDAPLEVDRRRRVAAGGLDDELVLHWWAESPCQVSVLVDVDADFADIFEIRGLETGPATTTPVRVQLTSDGIRFADDETGLTTVVRFSPAPESQDGGVARWAPRLRRGEPWRLRVTVETGNASASVAGRRDVHPAVGCGRKHVEVRSDPPDLARACRRSLADLDALGLPDGLDANRRLVAAGIPWFVALFGRDSVIAGHQARAFLPGQMIDTLAALAARQGRVSGSGNEEEPGKILHEVRLTPRPWLGQGTAAGARPYYGSIDATPLFLILYGTAFRWGASRSAIEELLPAARAALGWMRGPGDPDGDGLLEYRATGGRSLSNQSWKDSENAVQFPDGCLADGPIAMVEVQGYAYRARRELAQVLRHLGEDREAAALDAEAEALRDLIRERYWCAGTDREPGFFALALDGRKRRVTSVASNMGHLLWCDVPSDQEAAQVARHLAGPELASGWGLRTLSRRMAGFNPISYHVGSVWPHDTALACEGLHRFGLDEPALALASDLMEALALFDHRLPELFGGHDRERGDVPVPYPTACRPQAWAAGVPLQLATMFLGLEPHVPDGRLSLRPVLPESLNALEVRGIPFPGGPLSVRVERDVGTQVLEAPADLVVEFRAAGSGPVAADVRPDRARAERGGAV